MTEPIASNAPAQQPEASRSLLAITRSVVTSREFALRVMIGVVGTVTLGWIGPRAALLGLVLSQLFGDVVKELVTARSWSLRRIWFVVALALLVDLGKREWKALRSRPVDRVARTSIRVPVVSTVAATAVVVGALTAVDAGRGQSLLDKRHTTFFGGRVEQRAEPSLRLPDGRIVTSSARLAFGTVRVGASSQPVSLELSSGSQDLREIRVAAMPAAFRLESGCPDRLRARSSCSVIVVFEPRRAGELDGRLTISFVHDPQLALELTGTAIVRMHASISPPSLTFDRTELGSTAPALALTLDAGSAPLPIAAIRTDSKEFAPTASACGRQVPAGGSCTIRVTFSPAAAGTRAATLTVARTDGGRPLTAALSGIGGAPPRRPTLVPAEVDFGTVEVGSESTPATFTLRAGSAELAVGGATVPAGFRVRADACPTTLAPRSSCTIEIAFAPSEVGVLDGTLTLAPAGGATPLRAVLHGSGTQPAAAELAPAKADFGTVELASRSTPATFTLTAGSTTLTVGGIATDSGDYEVAGHTCSGPLAPHGSCTLDVVFAPTASGTRVATLSVDVGTGSPLTAVLTGVGHALPATLTPDRADLGTVRVGARSQPVSFTLAAGSAPLPIGRIGVASKDYRITANACPSMLETSRTCTIGVTFVPVAEGARPAMLTVTRSDGGPPLTAALTGVGLAVPATLAPSRADFGSVALGATSKESVFVVSAGTSTLPLARVTTASKDFRITANTCTGALGPQSGCTIAVVFAPAAAGSRTATLTVSRSDGGPPLTAALGGVGLAPFVTLAPTSLDFGGVCSDCQTPGPTKPVTLSNTGSAPLTIRAVTSSDPKQFAVAIRCPTTLAPGEKCAFYVRFDPATAAPQQATITVAADGGGQHTLAVKGSGVVG